MRTRKWLRGSRLTEGRGQRSGSDTVKGQRRILRRCSWRKWGRTLGTSSGRPLKATNRRLQKEDGFLSPW